MGSTAVLGCSLFIFGCAASTGPHLPDVSAYKVKRPEIFPKVIRVEKMARKLVGASAHPPAADRGPTEATRARLLWRRGWNWTNEDHVFNRDLNLGLSGGPIVSFDAALPGKMSAVSIEARVASYRYSLPEAQKAAAPDEILRERDNKQSVEAGLYFNFTFGK